MIGIIHYHILIKKIDVYVNRNVDMNVKYTANAIPDLCGMRELLIILNCMIILARLNNLFNICVDLLNQLYVQCVYIYKMQILYAYVCVYV